MKEILLSEDVVPIGEFKAHAAKWLAQVKETDHPLIITQNGRPAGVLLSPQEFDRFQEKERFFYSVAQGLEDIKGGRVFSTKDLKERLA
ncbi:MAG: type II toxin-antitoxin system Phd/YefM family antitoxin [Proteobacteria bacterium]|nr:type II toxin-antitoxin system Phd/YefM family antitoxin [Pseudomonadota bacterium]